MAAGHRHPPDPPFKHSSLGTCMGCGDDTGRSNGRWCGACRVKWWIITSPSSARYHVARRDRGVCCECKTEVEGAAWQVDHVLPLWQADRDPWFWTLENLQTLCIPCHQAKSAREANQRAKEARIRRKMGVDRARYRNAKARRETRMQMRLPW